MSMPIQHGSLDFTSRSLRGHGHRKALTETLNNGDLERH
jgi:hypothetical protein